MNIKITESGNNVELKIDGFSLSQTLDCGQCFRFEQSGGVWSGIALGRELKMRRDGDTITFFNMKKDEFMSKYYDYFTLGFDYDTLKAKLSADETLRAAIDFAGGIHILKQDKWETLCSFIISQNNNIPRIKGIIGRLCESFGQKIDGGYDFPSANVLAALDADALSPIRAGFRAKYIIDAAQKVSSGEVNLDILESAPLDDARAELMKIKGVGPKVAECVLLFSCKRFDAFPVDVWIKRVMANLYPNGLPEFAAEYGGIAQQYLFHYARCGGISLD